MSHIRPSLYVRKGVSGGSRPPLQGGEAHRIFRNNDALNIKSMYLSSLITIESDINTMARTHETVTSA